MFWEVYALDRQEYLKSLTEQIRTKRARTMVAEEVEAHIEDQKQDFMAHGLGEEEAESMAVALYSAFVRNMTPLIAVAVVMSLNMGAFMSESIRGALLSVDEGQKEAAYSLGMTNFQLVTRIVIPQAVRIALPPLFNDVINLIKMTSLAFMLGVPDVMGAAKIEGARTFRYFEIYAAVMLIYWVIIFVLGILHKLLEKKCASMY